MIAIVISFSSIFLQQIQNEYTSLMTEYRVRIKYCPMHIENKITSMLLFMFENTGMEKKK